MPSVVRTGDTWRHSAPRPTLMVHCAVWKCLFESGARTRSVINVSPDFKPSHLFYIQSLTFIWTSFRLEFGKETTKQTSQRLQKENSSQQLETASVTWEASAAQILRTHRRLTWSQLWQYFTMWFENSHWWKVISWKTAEASKCDEENNKKDQMAADSLFTSIQICGSPSSPTDLRSLFTLFYRL